MTGLNHTQSLVLDVIIGKMIFCNQALASLEPSMVVEDAYFLPCIDGMFSHSHVDSSELNLRYSALMMQHPVHCQFIVPYHSSF